MEFHEKLQELRKSRGLTQDELAEALYVSRTAVSKWETARGYPSIDSLKAIAGYFSISIDELLTGEKLISIAEKENQNRFCSLCNLLSGITDFCTFLLIVLPIYPKVGEEYIYTVNFIDYTGVRAWIRMLYLAMFLMLILLGVGQVILTKGEHQKGCQLMTELSMGISVLLVLFLALTGQRYALTMAFLLLIIKIMLLIKSFKVGRV